MTTQEAQKIVASFIEDWCINIAPDFIEDSIMGGVDEEAIQALKVVGFDFNWDLKVTTQD